MALNKAQIIGNVTNDLELKQTPNGNNVVSFSVATNRNWTDSSGERQEQTEFHNIVLWGKLAETAAKFLNKGNKVYIEGRLQTRNWEAQDGSKRYRTEIVGEIIEFLTPKANAGSNNTSNSVSAKPAPKEEVDMDQIPF